MNEALAALALVIARQQITIEALQRDLAAARAEAARLQAENDEKVWPAES